MSGGHPKARVRFASWRDTSGPSCAAPNCSLSHLLSPSLLPVFLFLSSPSHPFPPSFAGFCSPSFHEQRVSSLAPGQHIWTKGSNLRERRHLPSPFLGPAPRLPDREKGAEAAPALLPALGKRLRDGTSRAFQAKGLEAERPGFDLQLCRSRAVGPWARYFLSLSSLLCATVILTAPTLQAGRGIKRDRACEASGTARPVESTRPTSSVLMK